MKYTDNIDLLKTHVWSRNYFRKREIVRACEELIRNHEESVSFIKGVIEDTENQIKLWGEQQAKDPKKDFSEEINLFRIITDFYRLNGRLAMIEMDVNTAYKHIFSVKSNYEYRFFARRIYTLFHEAREGLVSPVGSMLPKLEGVVDSKNLQPYKQQHSALSKFFEKHGKEFKDVRNTNEAHKKEEFEKQLESIESMSVADSISLIQEGSVHLANLNMAFMIVMNALSEKLGELMRGKLLL